MKKICSFILAVIIFLTNQVIAQQVSKPLQPGSIIPDIEFPSMLNYKTEIARLSDFKGKLVILDFWSIYCGSCIKSFPHFESLQKEFGERIMILPVSFASSKEQVSKFLNKRRKIGQPIGLPTALFETMENKLIQLFPTDGFPHIIWIDPEGRLMKITQSVYVNKANIQQALNGNVLDIPAKKMQADFDKNKPYLIKNNGGASENFMYRSVISSYNDSIPYFGFLQQKTDQHTRLFVANETITNMLRRSVYTDFIKDVKNKQLVLEVKNSDSFLKPLYDTAFKTNAKYSNWCYELILPPKFSLHQARLWMHADLSRFFNITTRIEKRKQSCLILKRLDNLFPISTTDTSHIYNPLKDKNHILLKNKSIKFLVNFLNEKFPLLVINETGYEGNINIELTVSENLSVQNLNLLLQAYGMELCEETRAVDMMVIKDNSM